MPLMCGTFDYIYLYMSAQALYIWGCWNTLNMKIFLEADMFCNVHLTVFLKSILLIILYLFSVAYFLIIRISAGQWLIAINRI